MPTKVTLTVSKGNLKGKEFSFEEKESLIIGRQEDCSIVLPESTVSRYHCLIDIAPPSVMVRDFGSLNGTYLNGEKIGQRDASMSMEKAREQRYNEFPMNAGDRLGLGRDCEISLSLHIPQYCDDCLAELPEHNDERFNGDEGLPLCEDCYTKRQEAATERERHEAEKRGLELAAKEKAAEKAKRNERKCEICGKALQCGGDEPNICPTCRQNPAKVLEFLLRQALNGVGDAREIQGYRKIRSLGRGGMGEVWLVEEEKTGKQMALKLMLPRAAANERSRDMFLREAFIAGQLDHKNVVRQYKCGRSGDTYFILMELCSGGSVDNLMEKSGGKLSIDLATSIILQVLEGLDYTHNAMVEVKFKNGSTEMAHGIVHRDFKPGNIFLTGDAAHPTAKVADFGLAKAFETAGLSGHTSTGQLAGTPKFMPYQQIKNYRYAKPDVDVWAAAASYYLMLTGTLPKDFGNKDAIAVALTTSAVPIRKRDARIPRALADVIDAALVEKPDIGIKTAAELKKKIEGAI